MIKSILFTLVSAMILSTSCKDAEKDSPQKADSTNEAKTEDAPKAIATDEATTKFLVDAADGGLAEVAAGKMGEEKATNPSVKRFAAMMVHDHTGANAEVMTLAKERNVTLPTSPADEKKTKAEEIGKKTGKDFDKAFMNMMVDEHKETIRLFEKASDDTKDNGVKTFITNTLPKLKMHLDSAQMINNAIKK